MWLMLAAAAGVAKPCLVAAADWACARLQTAATTGTATQSLRLQPSRRAATRNPRSALPALLPCTECLRLRGVFSFISSFLLLSAGSGPPSPTAWGGAAYMDAGLTFKFLLLPSLQCWLLTKSGVPAVL